MGCLKADPDDNAAMTKKPFARGLVGWLIEPLAMVILMVCATTAIAQPFYIPSGSMEPTLQIGDMLLGTKYAYGYSRWSLPGGYGPASQTRLFGKLPTRGDVVIFKKPHDTGVTLIKRVVGLGHRLEEFPGHVIRRARAGGGVVVELGLCLCEGEEFLK